MKTIETIKGEFEIVKVFDKFPKIKNWYIKNDAIKLSEITEGQASKIMRFDISKIAKYNIKYLHQLLEDNNIEITSNAYIFKA